MPSKELNLLIVSTGLAVNVYALNSVGYAIPMPGYGGHFQFLTVCGLVVATLSAFVRILNLLTGSFRPVYEALSAVATPVEGLISLLYWPIILYNRDLIIPVDFEFNMPLLLDLSLHLIPTVVCWVDFLVFNKSFKRSPHHILAIYAFSMMYYAWANYCFEQNGYWPYPLLGHFTDMQRGVFFLFCGWFCALIYKLIARGHAILHVDKEVKAKQDTRKNQ